MHYKGQGLFFWVSLFLLPSASYGITNCPRVPETRDLLSSNRHLQRPHTSKDVEGPLPFAAPKSSVGVIAPAWPPFEKKQKSGLLGEREFTWNDASENAASLDLGSLGKGELSPCVFSFSPHHLLVKVCAHRVLITELTYAVLVSTQASGLPFMLRQVDNRTLRNLRCREVSKVAQSYKT